MLNSIKPWDFFNWLSSMNIKMNIPNPDHFLDEKHRNPMIFHMLSKPQPLGSQWCPRYSSRNCTQLDSQSCELMFALALNHSWKTYVVDPFKEHLKIQKNRCFFRVMKNHENFMNPVGKYGMENGTSPKNMNSEKGDLKIRLRIQVNLESRNLNVKFQHGHVNIHIGCKFGRNGLKEAI